MSAKRDRSFVFLLCMIPVVFGDTLPRDYEGRINSLVDRHLQEAGYPVIHAFVRKKVKAADAIVRAYSRKVSTLVYDIDHHYGSRNKSLSGDGLINAAALVLDNHANNVDVNQWINAIGGWTSRSKLVVWILGGVELERLFQDFWSMGVANVIVASFNEENFNLWGYDPFAINGSRRGRIFEIRDEREMFPDKFFNMQGYPITLTTKESGPTSAGVMNKSNFVETLRSKMNFSVILIPNESSIMDNDRIRPQNQIVHQRTFQNGFEIVDGWQAMKKLSTGELEYLYPYEINVYYIVVPMLPPLSTVYVVGQNWYVFRTLAILIPAPFLTIYLCPFHATRPKSYANLIRLAWLTFLVFATCFVEEHLIEIISTLSQSKPINTLSDLARSKLPLVVDKNSLEINKSGVPVRLVRKIRTNLNFNACLERLLNYGNVSCAADKLSAILDSRTLAGIKGDYKAHLVPNALGNFYRSRALKRGLPYSDTMDRISRRLYESGLELRDEKLNTNLLDVLLKNTRLSRCKIIPIKMEHLRMTLYACFVGVVISVLIFMKEMHIDSVSNFNE